VDVEKGAKRGAVARIDDVGCRDSIEVVRRACAEKLLVAGADLEASRSCECLSRPVRASEAMFAAGYMEGRVWSGLENASSLVWAGEDDLMDVPRAAAEEPISVQAMTAWTPTSSFPRLPWRRP
jgi:hypothetical protein